MLEMGPNEQSLAKQHIRAGQPLPDRIANAPELKTGLQVYLIAFFDLDSERMASMGIGRIPFSAIVGYATYYDFDELQTEQLLYFVRLMDITYIKHMNEKNKDD